MRSEQAVIAYGGNLGDVRLTIDAALALIASHPMIKLLKQSSLYESHALTPQGIDPSKPKYLNGVAKIQTSLNPKQLLGFLNQVENYFGRIRSERWASRTLDLDIITFGDRQIQSKTLVIPHPRAMDRAFVLVPWAEIAPEDSLAGVGQVSKLASGMEGEVWRV